MRVFDEYQALNITIGKTEREILTFVYKWYFQKLSVPKLLDNCRSRGSKLRVLTLPSLQPCDAYDGYRVINAHRVEVGVSAGGPASAPPPGPPAYAGVNQSSVRG
jgi:hypothetical protein